MQDPLFGGIHKPFSSKRVMQAKSVSDKLAFKSKSKSSSFACTVGAAPDRPVELSAIEHLKKKVLDDKRIVSKFTMVHMSYIHVKSCYVNLIMSVWNYCG